MSSQLAAKTAVLVSGPVVARSRQQVKATAAESQKIVDTFSSQVEEPTAAMERIDAQVKTVDNVVQYEMALAEDGPLECAGHCPKHQSD